jgi:hypothetical protein
MCMRWWSKRIIKLFLHYRICVISYACSVCWAWQCPRLHETCCRCNKTVGASQPHGADDIENVRGRNTTVRLYQEEVWEGTCNCLGPECVGWLIAAWQQVYLLTSHLRKHHVLTSVKCWYCYSTPDVVVIQLGLGPSGIVCECTLRQLGTEGEETSWGVSCTFPPKNMWKLPSICSYALWCGAWSQEWWMHVVRRSCRWCSIGQPSVSCYIWETTHCDAGQGSAHVWFMHISVVILQW